MVPRLLTSAEITAGLQSLPDWRQEDGCLVRTFLFADFRAAFAFMTRVAVLADAQDHHPDWRNCWNRVDVRLSTHDAGGITVRDLALAAGIDRLSAVPADGAP